MFSGYYHEEQHVTPFEKCRKLLLELALEQRSDRRNIDKLVRIKSQISTFPVKTIVSAFDAVVDEHGWLEITPKELK